MRVDTVDGLVTLFYDGSKELYNQELNDEWRKEYYNHDRNDADWEDWDLSDKCKKYWSCLLYTSPSPRDMRRARMPSSA